MEADRVLPLQRRIDEQPGFTDVQYLESHVSSRNSLSPTFIWLKGMSQLGMRSVVAHLQRQRAPLMSARTADVTTPIEPANMP